MRLDPRRSASVGRRGFLHQIPPQFQPRMPRPDTSQLKRYLQGRKRQKVSHPVVAGEEVRVEDVTRNFWSYRHNGELHVCQFASMRQGQVDVLLAHLEG
jgi:hypothetical protein